MQQFDHDDAFWQLVSIPAHDNNYTIRKKIVLLTWRREGLWRNVREMQL